MQIQSNTSLLVVFRVGISTKNWESPTILRKVWFFFPCNLCNKWIPDQLLHLFHWAPIPSTECAFTWQSSIDSAWLWQNSLLLTPQEAHPTVSVNHLQAPQQTLLLQIQEIYAPRYPSVTTPSFFSTPCYIGSLGDSASYSLAASLWEQ